MRTRLRLLIALIVTLVLTASCTADVPGVYRGGVLVQAGPLDIQAYESYRFVDKWRISHRWLSGPVEVRPCDYGGNPFSNRSGYEQLGNEIDSPIF